MAALDAQKAFNVVDHDHLLKMLYFDGFVSANWLLLQDLCSGLTSVVK